MKGQMNTSNWDELLLVGGVNKIIFNSVDVGIILVILFIRLYLTHSVRMTTPVEKPPCVKESHSELES